MAAAGPATSMQGATRNTREIPRRHHVASLIRRISCRRPS